MITYMRIYEQRKLLETRKIVRELEFTLETVSSTTQQHDYQTTTTASEYRQEEIYHTVTDSTSIVVYSPPAEVSTSFIPLVYFGSLVALFVLVFLLSKWLDKICTKQTRTSDQVESEVFEDCVKELCEDSTSTDTYILEVEWFDACAELSDADETTDVFEDCVDDLDQESNALDTDVYMDCIDELANESFGMPDSSLFMVSDQISCEDQNQDVLIAFGDFTVQETKQFIETTGFVLTLPEKNSDSNPSRKLANQSKEDDAFKTDLEISKKTNTAPLARELQAWQPEENDKEEELECLEKEVEVLKDETILSPDEMYRLNPDVKSTFLEDLSQYTTKLDLSSLSKEQIEFAERMANEIMKENKQRKNKQRRRNSKRNRHY